MSSSLVSSFLLTIILSLMIANPVLADPRANQVALVCSAERATQNESAIFVTNFVASMNAVTPQVARQGYATVMIGTGNTTVYAFGDCMRDLDQTDCNLCFAQSKTQMMNCLPFQLNTRGGRNFLDGCYLRYDEYDFFNESLSSLDRTVCAKNDFVGNQSVYSRNIVELVKNLSVEATKTDGFFVGSVNGGNASVYGLAQCWKLVNGTSCHMCLQDAASKIQSCAPKQEGRILNAGCYLRYAPFKFYDNSTIVAGPNGARRRLATILAIVSSVVAFLLIVAFISLNVRARHLRKMRERKQLGALVRTVNKSKLNFPYETLEKATNYFHHSCKLGQGGSGSVYKGVLPDGKVVAIKRLFFNTRQWVDHFFNEVNLISDIDHKHLVKLLGCSITGPESLLVYEYVPNQSLHQYLSSKNNRPLSWEERYKIILGTAEGLAYLHEESELRIIHRDIKLSNVLLEDDFTPKIADFGLARLFPEDKTHISTGVAGTLGYMAPEYVIRGKLTEKADVYSYGVLVIEVLTGRKCNSFTQDSLSILQNVWNYYQSGRLHEAVDSVLEGNFPEEEASRALQVGLVCVQASAELRPAMSMVVKMLSCKDHEIPQPSQPPFLSGSREVSEDRRHHTNNSQNDSYSQSSGNSMTQSMVEPR